jgi:hypothetical protein
MSYSQYIGNGNGLLYAVDPISKAVKCCEPNTPQGVRSMRVLGNSSAPIAALRSAYGVITFSTIGGAGNITDITINGINQIGANVPVTVGDVFQTATDLAAAITSYNPGVGIDFTAEPINGSVYIYSSPADGATANGLTITVVTTNPAIVSTTVDFSGGSNQGGVYDSVIGYQFYLDIRGNASRASISISAQNVTNEIVGRGLQTGIFTEPKTINGDKITGITRCSAFSNILVDTESSAATDDLCFISPANFVVGDTIRLSQLDAARVPTVYDQSVAPSYPANILLTDASPFTIQNNRSIELRLQYDLTLGPVWVENSRSIAKAPNILSRVEMRALVATGQVQVGENYFIYDAASTYLGIGGILVTGIKPNAITSSGQAVFEVPDYQNSHFNFGSIWNLQMATPTVGKLYAYSGKMYTSLTGAIGTNPDTDATNWQVVPFGDPNYVTEIHTVQYNLASNNIVKREDKRGNSVTGANACNTFGFGNDNITDNVIQGGNLSVSNWVGQFKNNKITNSTVLDTLNIYNSNCNGNVFTGSTIGFANQNNVNLNNNNLLNANLSLINTNASTGSPWSVVGNNISNCNAVVQADYSTNNMIYDCNILSGYNTTGTPPTFTFIGQNTTGTAPSSSIFVGNSFTALQDIIIYANASNPVISSGNVVKNNQILVLWFNTLEITLNNYAMVGNVISNMTLFSFGVPVTINLQKNMANHTINSTGSTYEYDVNPSVYVSGTIMTMPAAAVLAGTIRITGNCTINKITTVGIGSHFQMQPIKIYPAYPASVVISPTAVASAVSGNIVSDGGAVTLNSYNPVGPTEVSDFYVIQATQYQDLFNGNIGGNIWIKQYNTQIQ